MNIHQIAKFTAKLSSIHFTEHGEDGLHIMGCVYPFDLSFQLKNWLRVQGVASKLYCFWATGFSL